MSGEERPIRVGQVPRAVLAVLCLVILGAGVASAADLAQPGQALYGTKTLLEDVRLATTTHDLSRADRAMSYAADRLIEARSAVPAGRASALPAALANAELRITTAIDAVVSVGDRTAARRFDRQLAAISEDLSALVREVEVPSSAVRTLAAVVEDAKDQIAALLPTPGAATQAEPTQSTSPVPRDDPSSDGAESTPSPVLTPPGPPPDAAQAPALPVATTPNAPVPTAPAPESPTQPQPTPTQEPPSQGVAPPAPPPNPPPNPPPPPPTVVVPDADQPQDDDGGITIDILPGEQPQTVVAPGSD